MTSSHPTTAPCHRFSQLAAALDPRSAPRLVRLFLGAVLARGRRTVTSWIRAAGLSGEYRACYTTVAAADEPKGWVAFFGTDTTAAVADILESVAARFSLESAFRDVKDVVGAGQQQVRFVRAGVGAFHLCLWTFTMTEAWAWTRDEKEAGRRSASPWDDLARRPSHPVRAVAGPGQPAAAGVRAGLAAVHPRLTAAGGCDGPERSVGTSARKKLTQLYATGAVVQSCWTFGTGAVLLLGQGVWGGSIRLGPSSRT